MTNTRFTADRLRDQVMIQDLAISPDGAHIAFNTREIEGNSYHSSLWLVAYTGGEPHLIAPELRNCRQPRFSRDGTQLLVLSEQTGRSQIWVIELDTGNHHQLFEHDRDISSAEWAPDGSAIAFTAPSGVDRFIIGKPDDPTARRITDLTWRLDGHGVRDQFASVFVWESLGGEVRRLTTPEYEAGRPTWGADSTRVGFVADLRPEAALGEAPQFCSIDRLGCEQPRQHTSFGGFAIAGAWSDSGELATIGMDETPGAEWAHTNLYLDENARKLAPELDRPIGNWSFGDLVDPDAAMNLAWKSDSQIIALVSDRGRALPYRFSTDGGYEALLDDEAICSSFAVAGDRVVVVATLGGRPGEIYAVENGGLRRITTLGSTWLPDTIDPERFTITHPDGHTFDTWLMRATGVDGPAPTVIQVHGGPHLAHGPTPWLEMLALADAGINVLYCNPRGSMGYGEAFSKPVNAAYGEADGADMLRLAEWAVEEGIAAPGRIGICGLSYGGFMTLWMLGEHPGLFAVGVCENPLANAIGSYGANDITAWAWEQFGHLPGAIDEYLKRSPFMRIDRNRAPLLLLQSDDDLRCPPLNTEVVFAILRLRGCVTEMIRYPSEPHYLAGIGRPDRRIDRINRHVDWFQRYL